MKELKVRSCNRYDPDDGSGCLACYIDEFYRRCCRFNGRDCGDEFWGVGVPEWCPLRDGNVSIELKAK